MTVWLMVLSEIRGQSAECLGPLSRIGKYESFLIYDFLNLGTSLRRSVIAFLEALRKWIRNLLIDDVIYGKILLWRPFVAYIVLLLRMPLTLYGSGIIDMNVRDGWGIYPAVAYYLRIQHSALRTKATTYSLIKHGPTTIFVREKGR